MAGGRALDKRAIRRELERTRRRQVRARLAELQTAIKEARALRRARIQLIREQCRTARVKLRERCAARREQAREQGASSIQARRAERAETLAQDRVFREADRRRPARSSRRERSQESDDAVRADLPPELVSIFDRVRRHIRGTARKTRSEAFLEWVESHSGEVAAMQAEQAEEDVRRMVREHEATERELHRRRRKLADAVPF